MDYAVSVWLNGTVWSFDELLITTGQFDTPSDIPEEDREGASNVGVEARSGLIILEATTDLNGSYSLRLPVSYTHLTLPTKA